MTINLNKLIISKRVNAARSTQIFIEITMINQTLTISSFDDNYWRQNHSSRQYIEKDANYEDYQLAYQTGHEGCDRYLGKSFDEAEAELKRDYESLLAQKAETGMAWDKVKDAAREAWDRAGTT